MANFAVIGFYSRLANARGGKKVLYWKPKFGIGIGIENDFLKIKTPTPSIPIPIAPPPTRKKTKCSIAGFDLEFRNPISEVNFIRSEQADADAAGEDGCVFGTVDPFGGRIEEDFAGSREFIIAERID